MKKLLVLLAIVGSVVAAFCFLDGIWLAIFLFIMFPLVFFYSPLLFRDGEEELTEEAKREKSGEHRWRQDKWE